MKDGFVLIVIDLGLKLTSYCGIEEQSGILHSMVLFAKETSQSIKVVLIRRKTLYKGASSNDILNDY